LFLLLFLLKFCCCIVFVVVIKANAIFYSAVVSQLLIFFIYYLDVVSFLWLNFIGALLTITLSVIAQTILNQRKKIVA
ncbi:MAG: hypothetical protein K2P85_03085, partial [Flavobacteriaceae bacterium]|nr:hypothetical protein [Flavobacteriaceae bacterium]